MTLSRFWRRILPHRPTIDPDFHARMHAARAFGVTQKRESIQAQRALRQERANRIEQAYLHRKIEPKNGTNGAPPYE